MLDPEHLTHPSARPRRRPGDRRPTPPAGPAARARRLPAQPPRADHPRAGRAAAAAAGAAPRACAARRSPSSPAVGVTWYTWLEQARDIQVSAAGARRRRPHPDARPQRARPPVRPRRAADPRRGPTAPRVDPGAARDARRSWSPFPACVQNSRYDILAYNRTYGRLLVRPRRGPAEDRNCCGCSFTARELARAPSSTCDESVRLMAAQFRASMAEHLAEPAWKALLKRLEAASPEFGEIWARHEVVAAREQHQALPQRPGRAAQPRPHRPVAGPPAGPRLVTYVPSTRSPGWGSNGCMESALADA